MNHAVKDRQKQRKKAKKAARAKAHRAEKAMLETPRVRGRRPVSIFSNLHPYRTHGPDSTEYVKRDRSLWA